MTGMNGKGQAGHGKPQMQPMPQEGVYPLHKFCLWLECSMDELLARFQQLGVPTHNDAADMAVFLAAIERLRDDQGEEEE